MTARAPRRPTWGLVLSCELRQLLRDRRALFAAVILPALLYPLLFWVQNQIGQSSRELLEAREVTVAVDLEGVAPEVAARARATLAQRTPIHVFDADAARLVAFEADEASALDAEVARVRRRALVDELLAGGGDVLVTGTPHPDVPSRAVFRVYLDVKDDDSREAADRAQEGLGELRAQLELERRDALLPLDPARGLDLDAVDVASAEDASGAKLGAFLPLIALLVLISGGSYAALAVFAGEREAGTLETLLVQPVPASVVAGGKYLAVLIAGLVTLAANLGSLLVCLAIGMGEFSGLAAVDGGISLARLAGGLIYLPACTLLCAILCLVCGKARSFRQGQMTILPIMILSALPTAVALQPQVEASALLAAIPFAGPALALRDALRGQLTLAPSLVMILAHALWTVLVLRRVGSVLDAERVLSSADNEAEAALRHSSSRHALRWGFAAVLALYVIGGQLQSWSLRWGLLASLWILLPALALACALRARRRGGGSAVAEFRLAAPAPHHLLGAALCVPGLVHAMSEWILPLQLRLLPMPGDALPSDALAGELAGTSTPLLLLLFALSPGIGEELFFRGPLLSGLRRDLAPWRAVAWQAFFFAAAHASIYRLIPTGLLGLGLGALALRARSVWPAMLLHAGYNGLLVLGETGRLPALEHPAWRYAPWLALPGLALCALPPRRRA